MNRLPLDKVSMIPFTGSANDLDDGMPLIVGIVVELPESGEKVSYWHASFERVAPLASEDEIACGRLTAVRGWDFVVEGRLYGIGERPAAVIATVALVAHYADDGFGSETERGGHYR